MRKTWIGLVVSGMMISAALPACTPRASGGEGEAAQASEDGTDPKANDPNADGDTPPEKGCDGPGPSCNGVAVGDNTVCMSVEELQTAADDACAAQGLIAVEIGPAFDCAGGESSIAKVLCCDSGEPANVPTEPPQPDPQPQPSMGGAIGDGVTCVPNGDLSQQAADACAAAGFTLADFYPADNCPGGESTIAKYVCAP